MELWIRSQKKEKMLKVDNIYIFEIENVIKGITMYSLETHTNWGEVALGRYETHVRAFEILEEIQNKINLINLGHDFGSPMIDLKNPTYIYQMPEK